MFLLAWSLGIRIDCAINAGVLSWQQGHDRLNPLPSVWFRSCIALVFSIIFHIFAKCCSLLLVFPVVFSFCLFLRFLFRALVLALAFAWTNRSYKIIAHDMHLDSVQNLFYPFKNWSWLKRNWILTWTLHDLNLHKLVVSVYIAANWLVKKWGLA